MNDRINFEKISDFPGVTKQVVQFEVTLWVTCIILATAHNSKLVPEG